MFRFSEWKNYIPLRFLSGTPTLARRFDLYRNGELCAAVCRFRHSLKRISHSIALPSGKQLDCYTHFSGSFQYISICLEDTQIALIETYLCANDFLFSHKLYLLDEHKAFAELLCFFVLYMANFSLPTRFNITFGTTRSVPVFSYKYSNTHYNPAWLEKHFPNESFFGKKSFSDPKN